MLKKLMAATLAAGMTLGAATAAHAEGQIRIAEQFGIVYLLLDVAKDQKLIEKQGKAQGLDIKVDYVTLSGGAKFLVIEDQLVIDAGKLDST